MPYREFEDEHGRPWRTWETRPRSGANVRPALEGGWISFESEGEKRRLTPVPREWDQGTDTDLRRWLSRATEVADPGQASEREPEPEFPDEPEPPPPTADEALTVRTGTVLRRARQVLQSIEETLRRTGHNPPPE